MKHVKVFVTKTLRFRAEIDNKIEPKYQVTVGGRSWCLGRGREYEKEILTRIEKILHTLQMEVEAAKPFIPPANCTI